MFEEDDEDLMMHRRCGTTMIAAGRRAIRRAGLRASRRATQCLIAARMLASENLLWPTERFAKTQVDIC